MLSNIVLDELDRELDRRGHRFVRYADDCNVYVRTERAGQRVMASLTDFIERRMRLKVNVEKSAVARPEERHFLGFSLRCEPLDGEVEVTLSKRSRDRLAKKVVELTPRNWGGSLDACITRVNAYLLGWLGFFGICTAAQGVMRNTDAHIRRRLRAIQLAHWKRKATIATETDEAGCAQANRVARRLQGPSIPVGAEPQPAGASGTPQRVFRQTGARITRRAVASPPPAHRRPGAACAALG